MYSFWLAGALVFILMSLLWLVSLWRRDASLVDPFWGAGFVILAWFYAGIAPGYLPARGLLLLALVSLWGLRLSVYLLARNRRQGEDPRYARWRQEAGGAWWWKSYFKVFLLQGLLMWLLSAPFLAIQLSSPGALTWLDGLGALVWALGFGFEVVGDWQLARFKQRLENQGQLLDRGLWRYTRHPNYFGEALLWWGYGWLALSAGAGWALYSPLLMTILLLRVSGVALLEKDLKTTKPGYADYIRHTSPFVPWPPKKN